MVNIINFNIRLNAHLTLILTLSDKKITIDFKLFNIVIKHTTNTMQFMAIIMQLQYKQQYEHFAIDYPVWIILQHCFKMVFDKGFLTPICYFIFVSS